MNSVRIKFLILACFLTYLLISSTSAVLAQERQEPFKGEDRLGAQLIPLFLDAVISSGFEDSTVSYVPVSSYAQEDPFFDPDNFQTNYPWLFPYLYDVKHSKSLAVQKWAKPIRISFGLPNGARSYGKENPAFGYYVAGNSDNKNVTLAQKAVAGEIDRQIPVLSKLTGLQIEYVSSEATDQPTLLSNLRIVLMPNVNFWETKYKPGGNTVSASFDNFHHSWINLERHIVNKTAFTPGLNSQVRGYFISNDSNEIQWAICYIWTGHENAMLEKLTQECLARSLGISNFFISDPMKPMSVLGLWNLPNADDDPSHSIKSKPNYIPGYSTFDKAFISALYDPRVYPGMGYNILFNLFREGTDK